MEKHYAELIMQQDKKIREMEERLEALQPKKEITMRFEKHNDMLFRMLDKPVPLTADAELPCLIRPIQDDSPMGRYVQQCWGYDKLFMREYTICGINADMAVKVGVARDTPVSIHMFEIIGLPVADGSKEWALYQMMQGKTVCHKTFCWDLYRMYNDHNIQNRTTGCMRRVSEWLESTVQAGWQIYEEHELKYKVGDWVECNHAGKKRIGKVRKVSTDMVDLYMFDQSKSTFWCYMDECKKFSSPSEVVVHIGCLSGTIGKSCEPACFLMWHSNPKMDFDYSIIRFSALDTQTRELVEGLLKVEDEE